MREKTYSPVVATAIRGDKNVMEPHRDRQPVSEKGPRFFELNGKLMFAFRIDPSTEIGPMEATDKHITEHAVAFRAFEFAKEMIAPEPFKRGPGRPRKDEVAAA
jgi:hypothetical protein